MALDAAILAGIRGWTGSTPADGTIETTFNLTGNGTVETTALMILRQRRADMELSPETFNVQGDYSQSTGKNLESLSKRIAELEGLCGIGADVLTTGQLSRCAGR